MCMYMVVIKWTWIFCGIGPQGLDQINLLDQSCQTRPDKTRSLQIHFKFKVIFISNYHFVVVMHPSLGDQG